MKIQRNWMCLVSFCKLSLLALLPRRVKIQRNMTSCLILLKNRSLINEYKKSVNSLKIISDYSIYQLADLFLKSLRRFSRSMPKRGLMPLQAKSYRRWWKQTENPRTWKDGKFSTVLDKQYTCSLWFECFFLLQNYRRLGGFTEWKVLYSLCKDKDGFLHKDTVRAVYDGSLFERLEQERNSKKESSKKKWWEIQTLLCGRVCKSRCACGWVLS